MNLLEGIIVVLDRPQDRANIGAVVRAMKNMGVTQLRLVRPAPFERRDLLRLAHRSEDVVDRLAVFEELDDALADVVYVVGTAALAHAGRPPVYDIRKLAATLVQRSVHGRVALLFGTEADGLDRHALDRCHQIAALPANPAYPALNLAQAVLLFLYELRMAAVDAPPAATPAPVASQAELEQLFVLGEEALAAIDFFKYNPESVLRTLRQLAYRAQLTPEEVALLMAMARQIVRASRGSA